MTFAEILINRITSGQYKTQKQTFARFLLLFASSNFIINLEIATSTLGTYIQCNSFKLMTKIPTTPLF